MYKLRKDRLTYSQKYYKKNKEKVREKNNAKRLKIRKWFQGIKATLQCSLCSESHPACLDFHHRDDNKEYGMSLLVNTICDKKRILAEMQKCDVLCSNCHRKLHALKREEA